MRVEDLKVFAVVAESKSIHRAAQRIGITQSAVSKTLIRLESEFGVRLLDRSKKGLELTEPGQQLLKGAKAMQLLVHDVQAEMAMARSALAGTIRFGTHQSILYYPSVPALLRKTCENSNLRFSLTLQTTDGLLAALQDGRLDFALCLVPAVVPDTLRLDPFGAQRFRIVASRGHWILDGSHPMEALSRVRWVLQPRGYMLRDLVDGLFAKHSLPGPLIGIETDVTTSMVSSLIRDTDLVSVQSDQMLASYAAQDLMPVNVDIGPPLVREIGLFFRRASTLSPAMRRFREDLVSAWRTEAERGH